MSTGPINQNLPLAFVHAIIMKLCLPEISFVSKFNKVFVDNRILDHVSIQGGTD